MASYFALPRRRLLIQRNVHRSDLTRFVFPARLLCSGEFAPIVGAISCCGGLGAEEHPAAIIATQVSVNASMILITLLLRLWQQAFHERKNKGAKLMITRIQNGLFTH